jgi:hypothetical protein
VPAQDCRIGSLWGAAEAAGTRFRRFESPSVQSTFSAWNTAGRWREQNCRRGGAGQWLAVHPAILRKSVG